MLREYRIAPWDMERFTGRELVQIADDFQRLQEEARDQ